MTVIKKASTVSYNLPTFNRPRLIGRAIKSILSQTYQNFKIIIVGDHCTDNTNKLIRKLNVAWHLFCNLTERGKYPTPIKEIDDAWPAWY